MRGGSLRVAAICASIFAAWIRSGNLIASWMKNTGNVVADEIPIAIACVEFHREAAHVARRVDGAGATRHR